ncbi:hypothetical protein ABE096_23210 [Robertmurraya massiliosenegalensis]|uniref:hypothetical protein n=1 Tax=Robertmurraya TaxID=2837507 RepID=UPI0039A657BE
MKIKEELGFSSIIKLSKFLEVNNPTLWTWVNNQALPSPENLFQIGRKIGCSIYELISEEELGLKVKIIDNDNKITKKRVSKEDLEAHLKEAIISNKHKSLTEISREGGFRRESSIRYFPLLCNIINENYASYQNEKLIKRQENLENALIKCLNLEIPISLKQCLNECEIPPTTAQRYAPDLCKKVTARYKGYIVNQAKEREKNISREIENIILDLHNKGMYPSINEINKMVSIPGILIERKYGELRKNILLSLGYK